MRGSLPWQGIRAENQDLKYSMIGDSKRSISTDVLCAGMPSEFGIFLDKIKALQFSETPKYQEYRKLFRDLFIHEGYVYDYKYDWVIREQSAFRIQFLFGNRGFARDPNALVHQNAEDEEKIEPKPLGEIIKPHGWREPIKETMNPPSFMKQYHTQE